jgi:ABC-2 type transport system ATP-binding protein
MALETQGLSKRYCFAWALQGCSLRIPQGKVAAIVGPNGSGKSTLLRMAAGLIRPTDGSIQVLGHGPTSPSSNLLRRIGYLDQERPLYQGFRVAELLRFADATNPNWNLDRATSYLEQLHVSLTSKVSSLSGGQQAQVALTLCLGKDPELLILDEPAAALDPLARQDLLRLLMQQVASDGTSVLLSTHAISDVAAVCDYLVILIDGQVALADDLDVILDCHHVLTPTSASAARLPEEVTVIETKVSRRESSYLVRTGLSFSESRWNVESASIEEIVLAYLRSSATPQTPSSSSHELAREGDRS